MAEQARLQELKHQLAKLDPALDEQAAKRLLLNDQVIYEEFQTVWDGLAVRNAHAITERIVNLGEDAAKKLTAYFAFGQLYEDQVSDFEFREAFLAEVFTRQARKKAESEKREAGKRKAAKDAEEEKKAESEKRKAVKKSKVSKKTEVSRPTKPEL